MSEKVYWVYILYCDNDSYYTGYTNDLVRRYMAHLEGKASKYTRSFRPLKVAQSWKIEDKSQALSLERRIKQLSRTEKEWLIAHPEKLDLGLD